MSKTGNPLLLGKLLFQWRRQTMGLRQQRSTNCPKHFRGQKRGHRMENNKVGQTLTCSAHLTLRGSNKRRTEGPEGTRCLWRTFWPKTGAGLCGGGSEVGKSLRHPEASKAGQDGWRREDQQVGWEDQSRRQTACAASGAVRILA